MKPVLTTCPVCAELAAEGRPHCITAACTWNVCKSCGFTYDRYTGNAFKQSKDRAEFKAAA
jgi:hypothetical protein